MVRREVIKRCALLTGAVVIGGELFITGCKSDHAVDPRSMFSADQIAILDEIGETIIPTTNTVGAKSIGIGAFMAKMVAECYSKKDQDQFNNGLKSLINTFEQTNKKPIKSASPEELKSFLTTVDNEARAYMKSKKDDDPTHAFIMMRQLTILGYCTSEKVANESFQYVAVPGRFDGAVLYKKGDKTMAKG